MTRRLRLTVVMTHPIQYCSPWFRYITREVDELRLSVLYASEPLPHQQGVGFDSSFLWDVPLREGYESTVLRPAKEGQRFDSGSFWGVDVPGLGRFIEETRPDVVLSSGWNSVFLLRALAASRRRGIPVLYRGDSHLLDRRSGVSSLVWRLRTRSLLRRFERFLFVGTRAREYLQRFGISNERMYHCPHVVDNALFARLAAPLQPDCARARAREELGFQIGDYVILFVGKLDPKKRPDDLVRAASALGDSASLLVVGAGPLEHRCRELARELGVRAQFRGFMNQTELGRAYAIADALVLPSGWGETWGLVVNEAMATGLPCVVSDRVGCAADLVEPGKTGEIFPAGNVEALSSALQTLGVDLGSGRSRSAACRAAVARHDFETAARGLLHACRSVVS